MSFTKLPLEIMLIIIQQLDTQSIYNMYYTCRALRNIVTMQGAVKTCNFSMNTLATVNTFKTFFFNDIANQIQELNLSGAPDLRKAPLKLGVRKLKNLKTLDISYTNLNLIDFVELYKVCPTVENISLNFMIKKQGMHQLKPEEIRACQRAFKNCKNVNFVGSATNLLYTKLSLLLLKDADLDTLKFTVAENDRLHTMYEPASCQDVEMAKFKQFFLSFLDWTTVYAFFGSFFMLPVLAMIDLDTIETIIIIKKNFKDYDIHSTPMFKKFFEDTYNIEAEKVFVAEYKDAITGNATIMIWDKESHTFDEDFFCELTKRLKPYFPWDCAKSVECAVPSSHDWFYLTPTAPPGGLERRTRAKRRAPPDLPLNFDELFKSKNKLKLSVIYDVFINNPITLSPNSNYLSKLTFLSLTGSVRYTSEFFKVLFTCCTNLITLNMEAPKISPCVLPISNYVHHSSTLKNLRLVDYKINFNLILMSLAKCKSLESVYLKEESSEGVINIDNPGLIIEECPNLYNIFIEAPMSLLGKSRLEKLMNRAKMKHHKHYLNFKLHITDDLNRLFYSYDPYISVFNLNPIKQVN